MKHNIFIFIFMILLMPFAYSLEYYGNTANNSIPFVSESVLFNITLNETSFNLPHSEIAKYTFDSDYSDSSGNGLSLIFGNDPVDLISGKIINSAVFAQGAFLYANSPLFDVGSNGFTISFWFKRNDTPSSYQVIISHTSSGNGGYTLYVDNSNLLDILYRTPSNQIFEQSTATNVCDDNWHLINFGRDDSGNVFIYVDNGMNELSGNYANDISNSGADFVAGRFTSTDGSDQLSNGIIDDLRFYNFSLSPNQRSNLYNSGTGTQDFIKNNHITGYIFSFMNYTDIYNISYPYFDSGDYALFSSVIQMPSISGQLNYSWYSIDDFNNTFQSDYYSIYANANFQPNPYIDSIRLTSSSGLNTTEDNLTLSITGNYTISIIDFRKNNASFSILNMPLKTFIPKDYSTFNHTLYNHNAVFDVTSGYDGYGGYDFNGDSEYLTTDSLISFSNINSPQSETINLWVNPKSSGCIYAECNDIYCNDYVVCQLSISDTGELFGFYYPSGVLDYGHIDFNSWHQITSKTYDENIEGFIDGIFIGNTTSPNEFFPDNQYISFGLKTVTCIGDYCNNYLNGSLSDISIYNNLLSDIQIQSLYASSNKIVSQELNKSDIWKGCAVPNIDGYEENISCSNDILIGNTPSIIDILSPDNNSISTLYISANFNYFDVNNDSSICSFYIDNMAFSNNINTISGNNYSLNSFELLNGYHIWQIRCFDGSDYSFSDSRIDYVINQQANNTNNCIQGSACYNNKPVISLDVMIIIITIIWLILMFLSFFTKMRGMILILALFTFMMGIMAYNLFADILGIQWILTGFLFLMGLLFMVFGLKK